MKRYSAKVKNVLTKKIQEMALSRELFVKNPRKDFIRNRKLPFEKMLLILISMGGNSVRKELWDFQDYDINTATTAAFVQQRSKILPFAFDFLFHEFTSSFPAERTYHGYRLLAVDGSAFQFATDPNDSDTYFPNRADAKGYNLLHLNALYDLCDKRYLDAVIQPHRHVNENKALVDMVDRSDIKENVIITADRGFESYNNFAHIEKKGWFYVIRVKDIKSNNGILAGLQLPADDEFDLTFRRILVRRQTAVIKTQPNVYRFLNSKAVFDYIDLKSKDSYPIAFRVARFMIPGGSFETVITNLPTETVPPEKLRDIYHLRWGIETSFRKLKYTVGLSNFHAKKQELVSQEIFARLIMYNFVEMITSHAVISKCVTKHIYQVNFTSAVFVCRRFLHTEANAPPFDFEALISRNAVPVRPDRAFIRNIRSKSAVSFLYRIA